MALPLSVMAQDDISDFEELDLEKLLNTVYTAARHRQDIGMSPSAITVITREDIKASGATTIPDLLRLVPGMEVVLTTPFSTSITSRLEWTYENNVYLVLVDNREVNIELLGQAFWEMIPISLEDIERIEIIRGPGSCLYGANALAGVVNISTRVVPEKNSAWMRVGGGEAGGVAAAGRASTRSSNWGFSVSGGFDISNLLAEPRTLGKQVWKLRALAERRWSESSLMRIDGGISEGSGVAPTGAGPIKSSGKLMNAQLGWESESLRGLLYWSGVLFHGELDSPLEYRGAHLATFVPSDVQVHTVDGEIQWTLPPVWDPLMIIVGGGLRYSWVGSDEFLDGDTFAVATSSRYHKPGVSHSEVRSGTFVHAELAPTEWTTITGGSRLDYNTETGVFLSPRLAVVFRPARDHFVRLSLARAFRKPTYLEQNGHLVVEFPGGSPIVGTAQDRFLEFMSRVLGNGSLDNEELVALELGYRGQFLDGRITTSLDMYWNQYLNPSEWYTNILTDDQGLPDMDVSVIKYINVSQGLDIIGGELAFRFTPHRSVCLVASWTHREVYDRAKGRFDDESPKNLVSIGGRFRTDSGFLGSLFAFTRSEFWDRCIDNPGGIMEPSLQQHLDNVILLVGRLGRTVSLDRGPEIEAGVEIFLPASLSHPFQFRFHEKGGGTTSTGKNYGGDELRRFVTLYLQGSF